LYDALYIVESDRINWPAHARSRLNNGSDRRRILCEGMTKLKEFSLFRDPNPSRPSHGVFQFRLPLNQAKSFV
jgi:hypothetical protein